jgi:Transcriptional regulator, AbiEi antitoxin
MSSIRPAERAAHLAATQHGLISAEQYRDLGVSYSTIHRRVAAGAWTHVEPGVYRMAGAPRAWEARAFSAVSAAGPGAVASHRTAAHLWGCAASHPRAGSRSRCPATGARTSAPEPPSTSRSRTTSSRRPDAAAYLSPDHRARSSTLRPWSATSSSCCERSTRSVACALRVGSTCGERCCCTPAGAGPGSYAPASSSTAVMASGYLTPISPACSWCCSTTPGCPSPSRSTGCAARAGDIGSTWPTRSG